MLSSLRLSSSQSLARKADRKLARKIALVFEKDLAHTDLTGIRFFVKEGQIEIRGLVASEADSKLLDSIVRQIPGANRVNNRARSVKARVYYLSRRLAS